MGRVSDRIQNAFHIVKLTESNIFAFLSLFAYHTTVYLMLHLHKNMWWLGSWGYCVKEPNSHLENDHSIIEITASMLMLFCLQVKTKIIIITREKANIFRICYGST